MGLGKVMSIGLASVRLLDHLEDAETARSAWVSDLRAAGFDERKGRRRPTY
jgi:hypothetical protein